MPVMIMFTACCPHDSDEICTGISAVLNSLAEI
jgi:hypothetical protein